MYKPFVSIVLPVYNAEKTLALCLDSLMSLDYPKERLEIIAVDNNSTDGTKDIISRFPVRYVFEKKRGCSTAKNKGIKESKGEFIAFIDADCVVESTWLTELIEGFCEQAIGGCGGEVLPYKPQTLIEKYFNFKKSFQKEAFFSKVLFAPRIFTGNAAYRRSVLTDVGLFDDFFVRNEDSDLSLRVYSKGYQLKYIPGAVLYHKNPDKLKNLLYKEFECGYTFSYLLQKHYNFVKKKMFIDLEIWIRFSIKFAKGSFSLFINLFTKKSAAEKLVPFFDILANLAWSLGIIYGFTKLRIGLEKVPHLLYTDNRIVGRIVNDRALISDLNKGTNYALNDIGTKIWTSLIEGKDIFEIVDIIADKYESDDKKEIENDLIQFINELKKENLTSIDKSLVNEMRLNK